MAKAVVQAAEEKGLFHEEMHSKVEYLVAHGISTTINGKRAVIGSWHFVFEDEKCTIPEGKEELFENLPVEYTHLYLAIENQLAAVISSKIRCVKKRKQSSPRLEKQDCLKLS